MRPDARSEMGYPTDLDDLVALIEKVADEGNDDGAELTAVYTVMAAVIKDAVSRITLDDIEHVYVDTSQPFIWSDDGLRLLYGMTLHPVTADNVHRMVEEYFA